MPRFLLLDFIRFILAVFVASMHFGNSFFYPFRGYLSVDFFFILSGFVLCIAYAHRVDNHNFYEKFCIDRIARLYPLHFLLLLVVFLRGIHHYFSTGQVLDEILFNDGHLYTFLLNALMLNSVGLSMDSSWNPPAWSLSVEVFVNIWLGLFLLYCMKSKRIWPFILTFIVLIYSILFNHLGGLRGLPPIYHNFSGIFNAGLLRGFGGIALGMLCYSLFMSIIKTTSPTFSKVYGVAAVGIFLLVAFLWFYVSAENKPISKNIDFTSIILMFSFILCAAIYEKFNPIRSQALQIILSGFGAISYAIYIIHWSWMGLYRNVFFFKTSPDTPFQVWAMFMSSLIVISLFSYYCFENPMKKIVKKFLYKKLEK